MGENHLTTLAGFGSRLGFEVNPEETLTFVITKPCIGVKDASCLEVCPVRCIATTDEEEMYHIDAGTCINCSYCEPVCPVNAIFDEFKVPSDQREFLRRNREFFKNNP